jgi:hypothetical protein
MFSPDRTVFGFDFASFCVFLGVALMLVGLARLKFDVAGEGTQ